MVGELRRGLVNDVARIVVFSQRGWVDDDVGSMTSLGSNTWATLGGVLRVERILWKWYYLTLGLVGY